MNERINKISDALIELRAASMAIDDDPRPTMQKYNMLFVGEKFNTIYSLELRHCIKAFFKTKISIEDLNREIPDICAVLKMKCTPSILVSDVGKPNPPIVDYSIELY